MMLKNATGEALTVAEKNWELMEELMYVNSIVGVALGALAETADVYAANRLLAKTCKDVELAVSRPRKGGAK